MDRIATCIRLAAADNNLEVPSYAAASNIIGLGLKECISELFPSVAQSDADRFAATYHGWHHSYRPECPVPEQS